MEYTTEQLIKDNKERILILEIKTSKKKIELYDLMIANHSTNK